MQFVMDLEEFLFSVFSDEHCLCLAGIGSIVVRLIKALGACIQFSTLITAINAFFPAALDIRTFSRMAKCAIGTAAEHGTAASAPFSKAAVIA